MTLNQQLVKISIMEYFSYQQCRLSMRAVTKQYQRELRSACVLSDNLDYLITWYLFNSMSAGITEFCCAGIKTQNIIHPSDGPDFCLKYVGPYLVVNG